MKDHKLYGFDYRSTWILPNPEELTIKKQGPIALFCAGLHAEANAFSLEILLNVHGSLTYSGNPFWKEPNDEWWFGFDCSHAQDLTPQMVFNNWSFGGIYRTLDYVKVELESLANQLTKFNLEKYHDPNA